MQWRRGAIPEDRTPSLAESRVDAVDRLSGLDPLTAGSLTVAADVDGFVAAPYATRQVDVQ